MTPTQATATLFGGVALLERAISYTLGSLQLVSPSMGANATPCEDWDLSALLAHLNDSLMALQEAVDLGQVRLIPRGDEPALTADPVAADSVAALRNRATRLLGAWTRTDRTDPVCIGGCSLTTSMVTRAGAVEIAIHGWDVAQACGHQRPLPPLLAEELLAYAPEFVTDADRPARFAEAIHLPPWASSGDRLLAFLGRDPRSKETRDG